MVKGSTIMPAAATGPSDLITVTIADLSTTIGDEPRIRDCILAERLGFEQPRQIRELIERNLEEIKSYGSLSCRTTKPLLSGRPAGQGVFAE